MTDRIIDMVEHDGVFRRRRRWAERRAMAKHEFDVAMRRAWAVGLPMRIVGQCLAIFGLSVALDDISTGSVVIVVAVAFKHLAPREPSWLSLTEAVPEFE